MKEIRPTGYYSDFIPYEVYDIFKGNYWCNFTYSKYPFQISELIQLGINRKIIAERYNLKKINYNKLPQYVLKDTNNETNDHNEYFYIIQNGKKKWVCITSPNYNNEHNTQKLIERGYILIEPIYTLSVSNSFMKVFENN